MVDMRPSLREKEKKEEEEQEGEEEEEKDNVETYSESVLEKSRFYW